MYFHLNLNIPLKSENHPESKGYLDIKLLFQKKWRRAVTAANFLHNLQSLALLWRAETGACGYKSKGFFPRPSWRFC